MPETVASPSSSATTRQRSAQEATQTPDDRASTVTDTIRRAQELYLDAPAILAPNFAPLTYNGLVQRIDAIRSYLNEHGFGRGDRIATVLPNDADMAVLLLGIMDGATAVPLNPDLTESELQAYLASARVDAVVVPSGGGAKARNAASTCGIPIIELVPATDRAAGTFALRTRSKKPPKRSGRAGWRDTALVLLTTGTTSAAKIVPLNHLNITDRSLRNCHWLSIGPRDRCLQFMPLFHGQGINIGLIAPLLVGSSTVLWPQFDGQTFFTLVEEFEPTWYTAGPTHHQAILSEADRHEEVIAGCKIRFIRSGSGHLPPATCRAVEDTFGVPVIESYNTSEAGTLAIAPLRSDERKAGTVGQAVDGNVAVMDEQGKLLSAGETGEIVTRGDSVFSGYDGAPEPHDAYFEGQWLRTGDQGYIDAAGFLTLAGRIKEVINRGGEKIPPFEVEDALLRAPGVAEAVVFPVPHRTLNEDVAAAVVPSPGAEITQDDLRRALTETLAPFKVPRNIVFVDAIPRQANGKIRRLDMAERLGLGDGAARGDAAESRKPETATEIAVARIWADQLRLDHVSADDDFFQLGGDSLQAIQILMTIEKRLGKTLPRAALFEASTVAALARWIDAEQSFSCLVPIQSEGEEPPFFCIHDGFGHVLNFRNLARYLGTDQPFYGVQAIGTDGQGDLRLTVEEMAQSYIDEIRRVQPTGPYYLGGYSFGGKIALELALLLKASGEDVALLALLDSSAPEIRKLPPVSHWIKTHVDRFASLSWGGRARYLGLRGRNLAELLYLGTRQLRLQYALWQLRRGRRLPHHYLHDVSLRAAKLYKQKTYDGHTVLFRAQPRALTNPDVQEAWNRFVTGDFQIRPIPGEHHTIVDEPFVQGLAKELREALREARGLQNT